VLAARVEVVSAVVEVEIVGLPSSPLSLAFCCWLLLSSLVAYFYLLILL
jgi:hypothetical protein